MTTAVALTEQMHSRARSKGEQAKALLVFLQPLRVWAALEGAACSWGVASPLSMLLEDPLIAPPSRVL